MKFSYFLENSANLLNTSNYAQSIIYQNCFPIDQSASESNILSITESLSENGFQTFLHTILITIFLIIMIYFHVNNLPPNHVNRRNRIHSRHYNLEGHGRRTE